MRSKPLSDDDLLRLERLVALKNQGALSEAEFEEQKANVIASANSDPAVRQSIPAGFSYGSDRRTVWLRGLTDQYASWLKTKHLWMAAGAIMLIALAVGVQTLLRPAQVNTAPRLPEAPRVEPPRQVAESVPPLKVQTPPRIDTAKELRAAGWNETSPDGDGCMMERRGQRENGLNYVFIYTGGLYSNGTQPTYELSFSTPLYRNDGRMSLDAESNPELMLAVIIDGVKIAAKLQNHYSQHWEVEIPLTRSNRNRIARARSIALQLGSEIIAREAIRPNPTSISVIERCLAP
jgi:hypothetical protein